jgi:TonB family protein
VDRPVVRPPTAFTDVEQVRASGFKRAVSAIFGKSRDDDSFVPPRPVRQVAPDLPSGVQVADDTRVSVKVLLDETGRVKSIELMSRNVDSSLTNAAMDAAKRWRFEPARQQQKKVSSSLILHFRFNRNRNGS